MNKYLEILLNGFDEESDNEMIEKIQNIAERDECIEMVNILVGLGEIHPQVIQAIWDEFNKLNK